MSLERTPAFFDLTARIQLARCGTLTNGRIQNRVLNGLKMPQVWPKLCPRQSERNRLQPKTGAPVAGSRTESNLAMLRVDLVCGNR